MGMTTKCISDVKTSLITEHTMHSAHLFVQYDSHTSESTLSIPKFACTYIGMPGKTV